MNTMRAARLYAPGEKLRIETVEKPEPRPHDVVVQVKACGVIPNMNHVLGGLPGLLLPPLPAIVGLDAAGIVSAVGSHVRRFKVGDRVYINPVLSCGTCRHCRAGEYRLCVDFTFRGYFGFTEQSAQLHKEYPWGGYSEFTLAPAGSLVPLPDEVTFEQAARFGYFGTSYAALKAANAKPGSWVVINGATGTLGVAAVVFALGMGVTRLLCVARNAALLRQIKALSPKRIEVHALGDGSLPEWIRARTDGYGPHAIIDCTTRQTPSQHLQEMLPCLQKGGTIVTIGGLSDKLPITPNWFSRTEWTFRGSCWFETSDAEEMGELIARGVVDLSAFTTKTYPLAEINSALDVVRNSLGGFANVVVAP